MNIRSGLVVLLVLACGVPAAAAVDAAEVVRSTGIRAGLVVHLNVTDGKLTAEMATQGKFVVHGIAATRERAEKARLYIASRGLHGTVSVEQGTLKGLPYVDNLVNLVVVDDLDEARRRGLDLDEVKRVLRPGGAAYLAAKEGPPTLIRKEFPAGVDEWTHWLHGPGGNNVSSDVLSGPAARLQWIDGPIWLTGRDVTELFAAGRSFNVMQHNYHRPQWARII
ncbi:MAG TPA: methyltransferase domain-containing protein, partial [Planctomycetota bacterium]|nr:methyltransferase domain-containing protein [Planctomycetota bacterium]